MINIKQLICNRFKTLALLSISITFSIVLLMLRIKITHSFLYLFLVWNLFLAVIPFAITTYLTSITRLNKIALFIWFCVWLLFLPNAPYIVTDLLHLSNRRFHMLWLDILVISSFALNGLILFYTSLIDMKYILNKTLKRKFTNKLIIIILFLSSFGVYLGRFLRYNSWEIAETPIALFNDILHIIILPHQNKEAWLFTFLFGMFLTVGYLVLRLFHNSKT